MFIEEMVFSGKHYYRQNELQDCLEACKVLPVESLHTSHCTTSGTYQAWWTHQKVSICFKATFDNPPRDVSSVSKAFFYSTVANVRSLE